MNKNSIETPEGLEVLGQQIPGMEKILTKRCLELIADLERNFGEKRRNLLIAREEKQKEYNKGVLPDFPSETQSIRDSDWKVASIPGDLQDRKVEITGPVDRKMVINALNSGAKTFMTDFEDSMSPTWENVIQGQINLLDLWNDEIDFVDPNTEKEYKLSDVKVAMYSSWKLLLICGICSCFAYILVLQAYTLSQVSYVAPFREIGVVFGVLLGLVVLKEKISYTKILGVGSILVGSVIISLS